MSGTEIQDWLIDSGKTGVLSVPEKFKKLDSPTREGLIDC